MKVKNRPASRAAKQLAKGASMKRTGFQVLTSLIAVVILGMPVIYAGSEGSVSATIPFVFIVGKKTLPAGQYTVSSLNQNVLVVKSEDAKSTAIVITMAV